MTTVEHKPDKKARPVHPIADLFPTLAPTELTELAEDIDTHGLHHPIVLDVDGQVLDGRNRLAACAMASVDPVFETYDGKDADAYVVSVNMRRRQMTASQIAITVARAIRFRGLTQREGAERFKLNQSRIGQANTILDHAPDLADQVVAGTFAFDAAWAEAKNRKGIGKPGKEKRPPSPASKATNATVEPESGPEKTDGASGKDSSPGKTTEPSMPAFAGKAPGKAIEPKSMRDKPDSATGKESTPKPDPKVQLPTFLQEYGDAMNVLAETVKLMVRLTEDERFVGDAERLAAEHGLALSEVVDTLTDVLDQLPMKASASHIRGDAT
jgi:ParB-like chromosome segregation protein Spo0J